MLTNANKWLTDGPRRPTQEPRAEVKNLPQFAGETHDGQTLTKRSTHSATANPNDPRNQLGNGKNGLRFDRRQRPMSVKGKLISIFASRGVSGGTGNTDARSDHQGHGTCSIGRVAKWPMPIRSEWR